MKKKQQEIIAYPKISFCATTIRWSYGGSLSITVGAPAGCTFYVNWGDSRLGQFNSEGKSISLLHDYCPGVLVPDAGISFFVEIFGREEDCRIIEFDVGGEMTVSKLDFKHCVELEALTCDIMYEPISLDLSKNTALRYLNCRDAQLSELDVSNNTELVELYCQSNKIRKLDLSNNTALRVLDCTDNEMHILLVWYGSQLKEASFMEGNNIDEYAGNEIMEIIESNPPVDAKELHYGGLQMSYPMPLYK